MDYHGLKACVYDLYNGIFLTLEDFSSLAMFVYLETLAVFPPKDAMKIDDRSRKASNFPHFDKSRLDRGCI